MSRRLPPLRPALIAAAGALAWPALAMDFKLGDEFEARLGATLTAGTHIRTGDPDPKVLGTLSTARVGLPPGELGGNSGGNDLNFEKNEPISTVVKGLFDFELKRRNLGVFVRASAWNDFELSDGARPYGNSVNGFAQNVPLSDRGFESSAQFSGAQFLDTYVWGRFDLGEARSLDLRLGRQVLRWGTAQYVLGGINVVNGLDAPATLRPGALQDEARVPVGTLYADFAGGPHWGAEAWIQYEFRPGVQSPCGTFFATANYSPPGCNFVNILGGAGVNDPTALSSGRFPKRADDVTASDSGQFGLSARYRFTDFYDTEVRGYAMNFHSRAAYIGIVNPNINGGYGNLNTRLTDPNGLKYRMVYPEDIHLYGVSVEAKPTQSLRVWGEVAYRPNQPLQISPSDLIAAFYQRSPLSALNLAKGTNALPPGASFDGWDRHGVSMVTLGSGMTWPNLAGAARVTLNAEIGYSHIAGLPDPGQLRYGRSEDYGTAAVTGGAPCIDNTVAQKSCAVDGFFTSNAWGVRARIAADYPGAFFGARLTPALFVAKDVSGNSYGGFFVEGRWLVRPTLRADWGMVYADLQLTMTGGGPYNNQIDRDYVTLVGGLRF
jgi:hypothetical protein